MYRSSSLAPCLVILALLLAVGCGEKPEDVGEAAREQAEEIESKVKEAAEVAGLFVKMVELGAKGCDEVLHMSVEEGEGYGVPGVSDSERWGMPDTSSATPRVRRSWSTLSNEEKKQVADAFVALKRTTADSQSPGARRADYTTFCEDGYARNLYDYYVELHYSAFVSMGKDDMSMTNMAHMGPQFLPWHRYLLLRIEADMQEAIGDPDFALPYWDWEDCGEGTDDGSNPCPKLFETEFLGDHGSCEDEEKDVSGYLVDQGFETHLWSEASEETMFNLGSLRCSTKPLQRAVGCSPLTGGRPPSAEDAAGVFGREVYDVAEYDTCNTDENVSMRQYLEGYKKDERNALCILAGCETHGLGHIYIGGDMGSGGMPTNDPMFFLHHANVDRLWAMWQDRNRESSDTTADYGNPEYPDDWRGELFNFSEVRADEMFDFRALGFTYDTNETR